MIRIIKSSFAVEIVAGAVCAAISIFVCNSTQAQSLEQMMEMNRQAMAANEAQMNAHMAAAQQNAQASLQQYIQNNRPQLEAEHQQYMQTTGQQMSLEQYVTNKVQNEAARRMAAQNPSGSNPMFEQQKRMFEQGQAAHQQRQAGYAAQNQNWAAGQQQIENNNQAWNQQQRQIDSDNSRFIQQGIQGNQYYRNSETGQVAEMPFAGDTGVYQNPSGDTWISGSMGQYDQVGPNGERQQMEAYEPEYYGEDY